jgi:hypothetical protein
MLLDREDLILQVHQVLTRIRSGLHWWQCGGARGSADYDAAAVARVARLLAGSI